jgi:GNAT superfamily N-acetyltransferase
MLTYEWSDWRNGQIWWIQSVYVPAEFRRHGVFRALYQHVEHLARTTPGIVGLRLYVEQHNAAALDVYHRMGLAEAGYVVLEKMF